MESSTSERKVSSNDSNLEVMIVDNIRQVGILTSSLGCFQVSFEQLQGARWMIIQGRVVDMADLKRCFTELLEKSELGRVLATQILSSINVDGIFYQETFNSSRHIPTWGYR